MEYISYREQYIRNIKKALAVAIIGGILSVVGSDYYRTVHMQNLE